MGKTLASAIIVEALQADYWKPVQAGDLDNSDTQKVARLISNPRSLFHQNSYALRTPMSPHAAAEIDGVEIGLERIVEPQTKNHLVIEGAGGILVPLNEKDTILDLIKPHYSVVVVSRHYLGSINHTLLTLGALSSRGFKPTLLFSGKEHPSTESIILSKTEVPCLGRISEEASIDKAVIRKYAAEFREGLMAL